VALVLSSSVVDLRAQVDTLVADDALITSPEQLVGDIEVLLEQHSRISEVIARRVGAAENVDATGAVTGKRMCSWLAEDQLLAKGAAARLRRLGRHLPKFAAVRAALASGAINDAHADAMLEALTTLSPEVAATVEPMLVEQGRLDSPTGVAETCDKLLEACGYEKASDRRRERRLADRGVDMAETLDGVHSIRGNLDPVVAAKVKAALRKAAEPAGPDDDRSPRQRLHDALGEIADAYLEKLETGTPSFSGAPSTVVVTMTLDQLEARLAEAREQWVTLPTGQIGRASCRERV